jgi:hypothetical protein
MRRVHELCVGQRLNLDYQYMGFWTVYKSLNDRCLRAFIHYSSPSNSSQMSLQQNHNYHILITYQS